VCFLVWASLTSWSVVRAVREANVEVDALAKVDVLEDVDVLVGFVLIVLAHCEMVNCVCCLMFCWLMVVNLS